jgi:precorrin-8X/cobalt-precorrin-8 methylmutase
MGKDASEPSAPLDIETRSFEIIETEVPEPRPFQGREWAVVRRMIHASADFELLRLVRFHPEAVSRGFEALKNGCSIVTDTQMTKAGITSARMDRLGCTVACHLSEPEVARRARAENRTRSAVAVEWALEGLDGGIYVVGNAPTALFELLEQIGRHGLAPALVVGMPVGFVGAAEAKEALMNQSEAPFVSLTGRKGGSALAAACVNALAELALEPEE